MKVLNAVDKDTGLSTVVTECVGLSSPCAKRRRNRQSSINLVATPLAFVHTCSRGQARRIDSSVYVVDRMLLM